MQRRHEISVSVAEKPALTDDEQRATRLTFLADRLMRPDGLDRETLERIEELAGDVSR